MLYYNNNVIAKHFIKQFCFIRRSVSVSEQILLLILLAAAYLEFLVFRLTENKDSRDLHI